MKRKEKKRRRIRNILINFQLREFANLVGAAHEQRLHTTSIGWSKYISPLSSIYYDNLSWLMSMWRQHDENLFNSLLMFYFLFLFFVFCFFKKYTVVRFWLSTTKKVFTLKKKKKLLKMSFFVNFGNLEA